MVGQKKKHKHKEEEELRENYEIGRQRTKDRSKTMSNHENERKTQKKNNVEHGKII